jgi:hypothetical protein
MATGHLGYLVIPELVFGTQNAKRFMRQYFRSNWQPTFAIV